MCQEAVSHPLAFGAGYVSPRDHCALQLIVELHMVGS